MRRTKINPKRTPRKIDGYDYESCLRREREREREREGEGEGEAEAEGEAEGEGERKAKKGLTLTRDSSWFSHLHNCL